jgi:hypothetical protein
MPGMRLAQHPSGSQRAALRVAYSSAFANTRPAMLKPTNITSANVNSVVHMAFS